jgi:hypothetical protein
MAVVVAYAQYRHNKQQQQRDRWWDTLTWVYDRTVVDDTRKTPLPQRTTFSLLSALNEEAKGTADDRLQSEAIGSIIELFRVPGETRAVETQSAVTSDTSRQSSDQDLIPVVDPITVATLNQLRMS